MSSSSWSKLRLLLWKNYILQIRHKVQTFSELILPLFFAIVLVGVRDIVSVENVEDPTIYEPFPMINEKYPFDPAFNTSIYLCDEILYSPRNTKIDQVLQFLLADYFKKFLAVNYTIQGFSNEAEILKYYDTVRSKYRVTYDDQIRFINPVLTAIVFPDDYSDIQNFPENIEYKIRFPEQHRNSSGRWDTAYTYPISDQNLGPRQSDHIQGGRPGYFREGFLFLQHGLDNSIIKSITGNDTREDFEINLRRYPHPPHLEDDFLLVLQIWLPLIMMLGYIYPVINITKAIVVEKERRLKESMKMMGLPNYLHILGHFIKSVSFLLVSTFLLVAIITIPWYSNGLGVLSAADSTVVFLFFFVFLFSVVTFAFLVSALFSKANSAATAAGVIWFLSFFPYGFMEPRYYDLSLEEKIAASLFSNTGMAFGCLILAKFEGTGAGIQWSTINSGSTPDENMSLLHVILVLAFDAVFYFILALYIEGIRPGEFGVPLPWNFPFKSWYWTGKPRKDKEITVFDNFNINSDFKNNFETEKSKSPIGIQITGLTKMFNGGKKLAVNNLNLNMYENQITALLGHNGAGKSTTMGMLTGLFPPSSGTAYLNGFDIRKDIKSVRESLGLCPQHDVLFDELTVEEHLRFFTQMKGFPKDQVQKEIDRMLLALNLEDKRHAQSATLSGGMKRKLSVGIALCGGSKVVLLDEPTSGMDPGARRSTWDLMKSEKKNRTILLSTHFMEEADLLGDRIAILSNGIIQCCGGSLFLKKRFGGGYHLIIVKGSRCNVNQITEILAKRIPGIQIGQDVGAELSYSLPDEKSHLFAEMFEELERRKFELGISSYGASITTMEEVFMRVGKEADDITIQKKDLTNVQEKYMKLDLDLQTSSQLRFEQLKNERNSGFALLRQQLWAMIVKKAIYATRNKILLTTQTVLPVLFLVIALILVKTLPSDDAPPELVLDLKKLEEFGETRSPYNCPDLYFHPLCDIYEDFINFEESLAERIPQDQNFIDYILQKSEEIDAVLNFRYILGLEVSVSESHPEKTNLTAYFNNQVFHSPAISLNFLSNSLLRFYTGNPGYKIKASNHPLPRNQASRIEDLGNLESSSFQIGFNISFGMSFLSASFVVFLIRERVNRAKHLQFVSGVRYWLFWAGNLIFDGVNYVIPCIFLIITLIAFQITEFTSIEVLGYVFVVLLFYGWAAIPLMYLFSYLFTVPSSGFTRMVMFNVFTGVSTVIAINVLQYPELDLTHVADILEWFFMIFPNYNLGVAVVQVSLNKILHEGCPLLLYFNENLCEIEDEKDHNCCKRYPSGFLGWKSAGVGRNILYMFLTGFISIIIILLIEAKKIRKVRCCKRKKAKLSRRESTIPIEDDEDVTFENHKIRSISLGELFPENNLILKDLTKYYDDFLAVDHLNLGVSKGECFGLLGVNGAGKTTTFKMLTGDLPASSGDAFIYSNSVRRNIKKCQRNIGYCPQFDAIIEELTGRETIRLFARLRGLKEIVIDQLVDELARDLIFTEHIDKQIGNYSGGNKRKLSTALALIGNPPLVFLDEPTTGMDPVARRHLWNAISAIREKGTSIVLTSHSMEECEALCSRLSIMVNGKFRCLGSPQHLKSKFGEGYTLIAQRATSEDYSETRDSNGNVQLNWEQELEPLRNFIENNFPGCILKDVHPGFVHYHVTDQRVTWGQLFSQMELAKTQFNLEAYSVGQTTLEQVFLNFTKSQLSNDYR